MRKRKTIKGLVRKAKQGTRMISIAERAPIATVGVGIIIFAKPIYKPLGLAMALSSPRGGNKFIETYNRLLTDLFEIMPAAKYMYLQSVKT